jgi:type IV secretory pathway component VirB8
MMSADTDKLPEGESLTAWRMGRVEKALEELGRKLDQIGSIKETVIVHSEKIASLERSRDRLIAAISVLATGFVMMAVQQAFSIFGG